MATSGEKRWPPVGNFVATNGEKPMAIDRRRSSAEDGHTPASFSPKRQCFREIGLFKARKPVGTRPM